MRTLPNVGEVVWPDAQGFSYSFVGSLRRVSILIVYIYEYILRMVTCGQRANVFIWSFDLRELHAKYPHIDIRFRVCGLHTRLNHVRLPGREAEEITILSRRVCVRDSSLVTERLSRIDSLQEVQRGRYWRMGRLGKKLGLAGYV